MKSFQDLGFNSGLYTFATEMINNAPVPVLKPYYEVKPYNRAEFAKAIDKLPVYGEGLTPLQGALTQLNTLLAPLKGHTVVFLVTDGTYTKARGIGKSR